MELRHQQQAKNSREMRAFSMHASKPIVALQHGAPLRRPQWSAFERMGEGVVADRPDAFGQRSMMTLSASI